MARTPAPRSSIAPKELSQLRTEIRTLGGALGRVITQLEGSATLETVERLRTLSKSARTGDAAAAPALSETIAGLSPSEAFNQAMAFTLYFELVNIAEENFRILLLRRRRAARLSADAKSPDSQPIRESIEAGVLELKKRGVDAAAMQRLVDQISIDLVFTAHPTESKRRTLLAKLQSLAEILRNRANPEVNGLAFADPACLEREIACLWLTDRSRTARPEVADEARTGLWYLDSTLYETLPRLHADMQRALKLHYPGVTAPARWLTFGSWIGGDRDGNPNVNARVTADILALHRRTAVKKMYDCVYNLLHNLTVSDLRDTVSPSVRRLIKESRHLSKYMEQLTARYPHEPYRLLLGGLCERLAQEGASFPNGALLMPENADDEPALPTETLTETLTVIHESLQHGRGALLAGGELQELRHQVDIFGLHAAHLDLRQHSGHHEAAVAELIGRADYLKLTEAEKRTLLAEAIDNARHLGATALSKLSAPTRNVVDPLRVVALAADKFGAAALGIYIISMTDAVSDVLEVVYLMKLTGANLPIAPLFETLDDLNRAPEVLGTLFTHPAYMPVLEAGGAHQHVMLGYSDSNKDCGYLTANWALYKAQETITAVCRDHAVRVTLFHGRGGSIARGGGPAAKAILAQPIGLRDGGIRVTEQGEVLSTRYHDADLAHRILEQMAYGVLLGSHAAQAPFVPPAEWTEAMEQMSAAGFAAYDKLVHKDSEFLHFWKQATPIDEISNLKFGSRPTFRRNTTSVDDLRAIPWVFSWMQSRFNFPGWYGLGSALDAVLKSGPKGKKLLRTLHAEWPFFQTLIDNAQLTMRKADMGIAELYAGLVDDESIRARIFGILMDEFNRTESAILEITGQKKLLAGEPVLLKSVELRNPYIDPLNYLQVEMMRRLRSGKLSKTEDESTRAVVELTINGISGGLKNTG